MHIERTGLLQIGLYGLTLLLEMRPAFLLTGQLLCQLAGAFFLLLLLLLLASKQFLLRLQRAHHLPLLIENSQPSASCLTLLHPLFLFFLQGKKILFRHQFDGIHLAANQVDLSLQGLAAGVNLLRDTRVDSRAGQLFEQFGLGSPFRLKEGSKIILGEQHGAGELLIIQPHKLRQLIQ